jgi:hypothetical protein
MGVGNASTRGQCPNGKARGSKTHRSSGARRAGVRYKSTSMLCCARAPLYNKPSRRQPDATNAKWGRTRPRPPSTAHNTARPSGRLADCPADRRLVVAPVADPLAARGFILVVTTLGRGRISASASDLPRAGCLGDPLSTTRAGSPLRVAIHVPGPAICLLELSRANSSTGTLAWKPDRARCSHCQVRNRTKRQAVISLHDKGSRWETPRCARRAFTS